MNLLVSRYASLLHCFFIVEPVRGVGSMERRVLGGGRPALVECHVAAGGTDTWRRRGDACGEEGEEGASSHEAW